jgi:hypothetical protein
MAFTHKIKGEPDHKHDTVAEARDCLDEYEEHRWEAESELAAERAAERFYEEGTYADQMAYRNELDMEARALGLFG